MDPQGASGPRERTPTARELRAAHPEVSAPPNTVETLVRSTLHESAIAATNYISGVVNGTNEPNGVTLRAAIYLIERVAPSNSGERDKESWATWAQRLPAGAPKALGSFADLGE